MKWIDVIAWTALFLAAIPAVMTAMNLFLFRKTKPVDGSKIGDLPGISILIPARDEEACIAASLKAVLANDGVDLEVIVLDDQSTDRTAAIVRNIAGNDSRVKLMHAPPLPAGWCGKQYACFTLAKHATHDLLVWIDADVRLQPDALRRMAAFMKTSQAPLITGFPYQVTITAFEQLLVSLINFILVGYLPVLAMRKSNEVKYAAGCGQLVMAKRDAYFKVGGHEAVKASLHDGIKLPRAYRAAGFFTDVFDATDIATCRMYHSAGEVWRGLAKNATEAMATPVGIFGWTAVLFGGHVLPYVAFVAAWLGPGSDETTSATPWIALASVLLTVATSAAIMLRFDQTFAAGLLRPIGIILLLAIQWQARISKWIGIRTQWRGRDYAHV